MSISIVSHSSYMLAKKFSSTLKYVLASLLLFVLYAFLVQHMLAVR